MSDLASQLKELFPRKEEPVEAARPAAMLVAARNNSPERASRDAKCLDVDIDNLGNSGDLHICRIDKSFEPDSEERLFAAIAALLQQKSPKDFWMARKAAMSPRHWVIHNPSSLLCITDPLQVCRSPAREIIKKDVLVLRVQRSDASYYARKRTDASKSQRAAAPADAQKDSQ